MRLSCYCNGSPKRAETEKEMADPTVKVDPKSASILKILRAWRKAWNLPKDIHPYETSLDMRTDFLSRCPGRSKPRK